MNIGNQENMDYFLPILPFEVNLLNLAHAYRVIPGNRNWQIETADWNLDVGLDI